MKKKNVVILVAGGLVLAAVITVSLLARRGAGEAAAAQDRGTPGGASAFYAGKRIQFIVPSAPGGGFDEYSRLLAPYLEKYTGTTVEVLDVPGAGGMLGVNELYNSPRDGLTLGIMNGSAMVTNRMAGLKGADYQIDKFDYLGRVVADTRVLVVNNDSRYKSFDDIRTAGETVKIGATGLGGSSYVDGVITREAFGLNVRIVHGFDSSSVIRQAMLRGELAGTWGSWGSASDYVTSGQERVLLQTGKKRMKDLPDVPTVFEFVDSAGDPARARAILTAYDSLVSVGRPVAATPGTPAERLAFLRTAFDQAMHDPGFVRKAEKAGRPLDYVSGEEMMAIIRDATTMQPDIEELFIKAIRGKL